MVLKKIEKPMILRRANPTNNSHELYTTYLERVYGIHNFQRYSPEYLLTLRELERKTKPYILFVSANWDRNGVISSECGMIEMDQIQIGEQGNVLPNEIDSFLEFFSFILKRFLSEMALPDVVMINTHGNSEEIKFSEKKEVGF